MFGKRRINLANFTSHIGQISLARFEAVCWLNCMRKYLPKAVHQRIFPWQKKYGEINPSSYIHIHIGSACKMCI